MKSILDATFKYVPSSVHADGSDYLRAKFRRIRREIEEERKRNAAEAQAKVKPMRDRK